ncbi:MAG: glycine/D-amino acid oxidase-like deaminating enzyme [Pseudorhodobacter sp.]|jgi:glycine/D-amino acid oxidase-like deaminating enzyme
MSKIQTPAHSSYDIVIVGGAMMGASTAWFLSDDKTFDGRVLVIERDTSYKNASTMHSNSCMRQQFSTELNVRISQFAADFVTNLRSYMGNDARVPALKIQNFGYLYLADTEGFADVLRQNHATQIACGAGTKLMTRDQIAQAFPFYQLDDIILGSLNTVDEGYWDSITVFDWWRRSAKERGVETVQNEVVAMTRNAAGTKVVSVTLKSGEVIACGQVLNASGPRGVETSRMVGVEIPVEPRKRFTWIFKAEQSLDRPLPLTIDPSGIHVRQEGTDYYQAGGHTDLDPAVAYDDFAMDQALWQDHVWPLLATRIPQFEAIKITNEWAGHYAYNTFDHNAIMGPHPEVGNFFFLNGFSGHGLQQSPAMGRGTAEFMVHGAYKALDMTEFHFDRIKRNKPIIEKAII